MASYKTIGAPLGDEVFAAQKQAGDDYLAANLPPGIVLPDPFTNPKAIELGKLCSEKMGEILIKYVPAYGGVVLIPPNTFYGVDLPIPSILMEVNGMSGLFTALWWKAGANPTDWVNLSGTNLVLSNATPHAVGTGAPGPGDSTEASRSNHNHELVLPLSTALPLADEIADPGNLSSNRATAEGHVHPSADTAGGDLYLVDETPATVFTFHASDTVATGLDHELLPSPTSAFDLSLAGVVSSLHGNVVGLAAQGAGYGLNLIDEWTPVSGVSRWQKNSGYKVQVYVPGGPNIDLVAGDSFYVANAGPLSAGAKYNGPYVVITQGDGGSVHAVIERRSDANTSSTLVAGSFFLVVEGSGAAFEGSYISNDTTADVVDTTPLAFTIPADYTPKPFAAFFFVSQAAIPNVDTWPGGTFPVTVYARCDAAPGDTTCYIVPRLFRGYDQGNYWLYDTGTLSELPSMVTTRLLTSSWASYTWDVPVSELTGTTSDRFILSVISLSTNASSIIHVGCDGGSNQTKVVTTIPKTTYSGPSLRRNPDSARPAQILTVTGPGAGTVSTFLSLSGDPGLAIWPPRTWRLRIWARSLAGATTLSASLTRSPAGTTLALNVPIGIVSSSTWTLFRSDFVVPETTGDVGDEISIALAMSSSVTSTVEIGVGLTRPSSLNATLLAPPGGTSTTPTDDHKVMVESDAVPGYLRDVVQSADGSVMPTVDPTSRRLDLKARPAVSDVRPIVNTNTGSGWLIPATGDGVSRSNCIRWTSTGDLQGINSTWYDGTLIPDCFVMMIFVGNAAPGSSVIVRNGATPPGGSTFLPLSLPWNAGDSLDMEFSRPTELEFRLDLVANVWRLKSSVSYA